TRLFWPFSNVRVAWDIIAIVDPIATLVMVVAMIAALKYHAPKYARFGIVALVLYLSFGFYQREEAKEMLRTYAQIHDQYAERIRVMPTLGNLTLWRGIYQAGDTYYVHAIRNVPWRKAEVIEGGSIPILNGKIIDRVSHNPVWSDDLFRFAVFADGYLVEHP